MAADHPPCCSSRVRTRRLTCGTLLIRRVRRSTTTSRRRRGCAYDRPGAPHLDQTFSRSDPVSQPTSPQNGVDDLVALLKAADVPGPYVLVAHSFSGTIAR